MDDNYFNTKGAILILQMISVHGEIMKETLLCTMSEPTKHLKSQGGGGGLHTWGRIWLTAHLKKTNDMPSDKMYGLFIHPHIYRKTCVSLSAISLALIPPSGGTSKRPPSFEMWKRTRGPHYSPWVMNNVLTWQVTVMYRPSPYVWHIEMIGVNGGEWWIPPCSRSLPANFEL